MAINNSIFKEKIVTSRLHVVACFSRHIESCVAYIRNATQRSRRRLKHAATDSGTCAARLSCSSGVLEPPHRILRCLGSERCPVVGTAAALRLGSGRESTPLRVTSPPWIVFSPADELCFYRVLRDVLPYFRKFTFASHPTIKPVALPKGTASSECKVTSACGSSLEAFHRFAEREYRPIIDRYEVNVVGHDYPVGERPSGFQFLQTVG